MGALGADVCLNCPNATTAPSGSESVRACASCADYRYWDPRTRRCAACPEFSYVPKPGLSATASDDVCVYCGADEVLMQIEMSNNRSCRELPLLRLRMNATAGARWRRIPEASS